MIILTDIHGCFDTMIALLDKIPQEEKDKGIVIAGDLIDRGPKSREVVQYCIDNNIQVVKGNHEEMMVDESIQIENALKTGRLSMLRNSLWTTNGGYEALESYIDYNEETGEETFDLASFKKHAEWMDLLPYYLEFPDVKNEDGRYLVVSHSNIGNVWKNRDSDDANLMKQFLSQVTWGRPYKIKDVPEIYNVIGHTPQEGQARIRKIYANIDTGAVFKSFSGHGFMTALQFPEMTLYTQENIEKSTSYFVE